eukprot:m51a1_g1690 hypothetical protein (1072) ;mRNA; r:462527-466818
MSAPDPEATGRPPTSPTPSANHPHGCVLYSITYPPLNLDPPPGTMPYPPPPPSRSPFAFPSVEPKLEEVVGIPMNEGDQLDPPVGLEPAEFDYEGWRRHVQKAAFKEVVPRVLSKPCLRPLEQISPEERCEDPDALHDPPNPAVTFVRFVGADIPDRDSKKIASLISEAFPNAEIVLLVDMHIKDIKKLRLERLRHLDVSNNELSSIESVESAVRACPQLEVLEASGNPVSGKPDFFSRVISYAPNLERLNGKEIDVKMRVRCIEELGGVPDIGAYHWDIVLGRVPQILEMRETGWNPKSVTKLVLSDQWLTEMHVGAFTNLLELDVSNNRIRELEGAGLEQLSLLKSLNLSNNCLSRRESLAVLAYLPGLQKLWLEGNKGLNSDKYPFWALYETRNLRGSNRAPGLLELDGKSVTLSQRVEAMELCGEGRDAEAYRLELAVIEALGHHQLRSSPDYASRVRHVCLASKGLRVVDVGRFTNAEVINLRSNDLVEVRGLEQLRRIKFVDLTDNPKLKLGPVLAVLAEHMTLEAVSLHVTAASEHKRYTMKNKYRRKVLAALLPKNHSLVMLDNIWISPNERIELLPEEIQQDKASVESYRFQLALAANYRAKSCAYGELIAEDPSFFTTLRNMSGVGLTSDFCNFAPFSNVKELNISHNRIKDLMVMGLQLLKLLRVLDVSCNEIETPLTDVAQLIDSLAALETVALRENPIMKSSSDRLKLIGMLRSMRAMKPTLKVIDTEVGIEERVAAWKDAGADAMECELMRFGHCIVNRVVESRPLQHIQVLDLRACGLGGADFTGFVSLRALLLRGNRFQEMNNIRGLTSNKGLLILDLRENCLQTIQPVADAVNQMVFLQSLGLAGNPFSKTSDYRDKFIRLVQNLWMVMRYPLGMLDEQEITPEEICRAASATGVKSSSSKLFPFKIAIFRRAPQQVQLSGLLELKLEGCGLRTVAFFEIPKLIRLSLANNEITSSDIGRSGIDRLTDLRALDLSHNKIKKKECFAHLVAVLPSLEGLWICPNPCFAEDSMKCRKKLFSKQKKRPLLRLLNGKPVTEEELGPRLAALKPESKRR